MKIENAISWCDASINAVTGCDKISPGCAHCYASVGTRARVLRAQGIETWGPNGVRHPVNFAPTFRRLNKLCVCDKCHVAAISGFIGKHCVHTIDCDGIYRRIRLFADSNSDWLDPKWPVETLAKFLDTIRLSSNVNVQLLTKRIELFDLRLTAARNFATRTNADLALWINDWMNKEAQSPKMLGKQAIAGWEVQSGKAASHVWLGVSAEGQKEADERIPQLLRTPAAIRFVSAEPLLETINFHFDGIVPKDISPNYQPLSKWIDWLIVGGESGDNRRDCGVDAIEHVVRQCAMAGVPVYCKQDVAFKSGQRGRIPLETWKRKEFPR